MEKPHKDSYTVAEMAEILGVCPNTIRVWDRSKKIVSTRTLGGHRRYSSEELNRIKEVMSKRV